MAPTKPSLLELELPNVRQLFQPDPGYFWFDADLSGADAMVVAWDADDSDLKGAFRAGLDVHSKNAEDMFGAVFTNLGSKARNDRRQETKRGVHAANYLVSPKNLAPKLGWLVIDAERFVARWYSIHPSIPAWHKRKRGELAQRGFIDNKFGYRRHFFDRANSSLPEAVAWTPQSTTGIVTLKAVLAIERWFEEERIVDAKGRLLSQRLNPDARFWILQVHDSLDFQLLYEDVPRLLPTLHTLMHITVPYADPMVIPWGLKISSKSWGDAVKCDWQGHAKPRRFDDPED